MSKKIFIIGGIALLLILGGLWLYNWVLGDTLAPSATISAPTLDVATATQPPAPPTQAAPTPTQTAPLPSPTSEQPAAPTAAPASAPAAAPSGALRYQIDGRSSQVSFNIFEELRGAPKDVIGTTNQVAGEVVLDPADLSTVQMGEIVINARTLVTDDDRRNQAIRNRILFTDQYEFITFTPTQVSGLSGSGQPGAPYSFQVTGDLTIRDVTKPVTFEVTAQADQNSSVSGSAQAVINRSDFGLNVPNVPFVANVGEQITLTITFVLLPVE